MSQLEDLLALHIRAAKLPEPIREFRFAPPRRFRADFAWPEHKLLAEVDGGTFSGGRHSRGSGIERDCEKYSIAAAMGYRVMRFTRAMVEDGGALCLIEQALKVREP